MDEPLSQNTVIYILAHRDREAAGAAWRAFAQDPEWHAVRDASEADGPVVASLERIYMDPTDFWMWQTRCPLDAAFLDADGVIFEILAWSPARARTPRDAPGTPRALRTGLRSK